MRPAFSLLTAIFVLVIMGSLLTLVSNLSGKIVTETTAQYRKEQAALLAKSYTEYAILAIQGHQMNAGTSCLRTITANINSLDGSINANAVDRGEGYYVEVKMQYVGLPATISCGVINTGFGSLGNLGATTSNDISVVIDVYVQYHDMDTVDSILTAGGTVDSSTPWITYHRRTIQKL